MNIMDDYSESSTAGRQVTETFANNRKKRGDPSAMVFCPP